MGISDEFEEISGPTKYLTTKTRNRNKKRRINSDGQMEKQCSKCKQYKLMTRDNFHIAMCTKLSIYSNKKRSTDGYQADCIACRTRSRTRIRFCWICSKKLWGNRYKEVIFEKDGLAKIVHISCADQVNSTHLDHLVLE